MKPSVDWMVATRATGEKIFAPNILIAEACAGISRGTGDMTEAEETLERLRNSKVITFIPITESLAIRAAEIGLRHKIRGCDAIYVAVAEQVRQTLVTLDNQQKERGQAVIMILLANSATERTLSLSKGKRLWLRQAQPPPLEIRQQYLIMTTTPQEWLDALETDRITE